MIKIEVKNFMSLTSAIIEVERFVLIVGNNRAGKSSFMRAAAAALIGNGNPFEGGIFKKDASKWVKNGTNGNGSGVKISSEKGSLWIGWPSCVTKSLDSPPKANGLAAGTVLWTNLKEKERIEEIRSFISCNPTDQEFLSACSLTGMSETEAETLNGDIKNRGWDHYFSYFQDERTKKKGAWEQIAKERWGESKGAEWKPDGLDLDRSEKPFAWHSERIKAIETSLKGASVIQAVSEDKMRGIEEMANKPKPNIEILKKALEEAQCAHQEAVQEKLLLPKPSSPGRTVTCPSCNTLLSYESGTYAITLKIPTSKPLSAEELKKINMAIASVDGKISNLNGRVIDAQKALIIAERATKEIDTAILKTAKQCDFKIENQEVAACKIEEMRMDLEKAKEQYDLARRFQSARACYKQVVDLNSVVEMLSPEGLRKQSLSRAINNINQAMKKYSDLAEWPLYQMTSDFSVVEIDEGEAIPPILMSESGRFRANLIVQLMAAELSGADMILVDGFDILDLNSRVGGIKAIYKSGIPAIVAMTVSKTVFTEKMTGDRYWIENGVAEKAN